MTATLLVAYAVFLIQPLDQIPTRHLRRIRDRNARIVAEESKWFYRVVKTLRIVVALAAAYTLQRIFYLLQMDSLGSPLAAREYEGFSTTAASTIVMLLAYLIFFEWLLRSGFPTFVVWLNRIIRRITARLRLRRMRKAALKTPKKSEDASLDEAQSTRETDNYSI